MGAFDVAGHGRPVIITGWGGHLDYLPKDLGYLVAYRLEPVREYPNRSSYRSQKQWALADLNDAIRLLRHVRDQSDEAAWRGRRLKEHIRTRFDAGSVTDRLLEVIDGTHR
jgi:hypothetical protein